MRRFLAACLVMLGCRPEAVAQTSPSAVPTSAAALSIVPWPQSVVPGAGAFAVNANTRFGVSSLGGATDEARFAAEAVAVPLRLATGWALPVVDGPADITFALTSGVDTGEEGYRLSATPGGVTVTARTGAGLFYGAQTLVQLLPPAALRGGRIGNGAMAWTVPSVDIHDAPRFGYRGLHLDVVRHFFPVEFVKRYIDLMARYKFNRFHWHLTDDQGWRIEIKRYPRLTEVGAWRDSTLIGHYSNRPHRFVYERYGGFYTQDEIREVVEYARQRHVTIVPEIEMPGHASAALAAYPNLGCTAGPSKIEAIWGVFPDIFCPKEETFAFLEGVLTEVMELFPGTYIHIGGDEAPKTYWEASPLAQAVMRREGLKDEHELQSYFIQRIERFVNAHGRRIIGWDEILEGGLAPNATVMSWRGERGGIAAAQSGHDVVMTPSGVVYFDHYQGPRDQEPMTIGGNSPLEKVYAYEPIPDTLTAAQARHILGAQANLWAEYQETPSNVEYMVYPRALALAEVVWSPKATRSWPGFVSRLPAQLLRLDLLDVNYRYPRELALPPLGASQYERGRGDW